MWCAVSGGSGGGRGGVSERIQRFRPIRTPSVAALSLNEIKRS